jgi:hypothetical protein
MTPPYTHQVANHLLHFVDPSTGVHINNVKAFWCAVKRRFKIINGCNRHVMGSYLDEHMYRSRFVQPNENFFITFIDHMGDLSTFE